MLVSKRHYSLFLSVLLCLFVNAWSIKAQENQRINLKLRQQSASLEDFLNDLEIDGGFVFSYSNKIELQKIVVFSSNEITINQFLKVIADSCKLNYSVVNQKIILEPRQQSYHIIYGRITSKETSEWLIGAFAVELKTMTGTSSNSYGFYSLKVESGSSVEIGFSGLGYSSVFKRITASKDTMINISLSQNTLLEEVSIVSKKTLSVSNSQMSAISLNSTQIKKVPSFFGENDLVKTLQLMPGIHGGSEGFSGLNVRGGGNEQNLILLDDVPLYGITHLLGMFSVFNSDAINQVTVLKGGFPARYGGRASSVIDIKMKEGNDKRFNGTASIGLSSARLSFDGPAIKNKSTFSLSFRRTFHDLASFQIPFLSAEKWNFYFYDVYAKYNHTISPRSRIYGSFFTSYDSFSSQYNNQQFTIATDANQSQYNVYDSNNVSWGNVCGSVRWNYLLKSNLFCNSQVAFTRYRYVFDVEEYSAIGKSYSSSNKSYYSGVTDGIAKLDFDYLPNTSHTIKFGLNYTIHFFQPGVQLKKQILESTVSIDTVFGGNLIKGNEMHLYFEDDIVVSRRIKMNMGIRLMTYFAPSRTYFSAEPRLSFRYLATSKLALKAAYCRTSQFLHLVNSSLISLPTDLWFPVTSEIKPLLSNLSSMGFEWEVLNHSTFSAEGYYKTMENILDVKDGSGLFGMSSTLSNQLTSGNGISYGLEFLYQVKSNKLTGWFGYTISKTTHEFAQVNNGVEFPARFDRRHDISISLSYEARRGVEFAANWIFGSGNAVTLPTQKYYSPTMPSPFSSSENQYSEMVGQRNGYRMPNYHRLDISATFAKEKPWGERIWSFGVYNVYGRENPFFIYFKDTPTSDGGVSKTLMQLSIFPVPIPYVRLTVKF